MSSVASNFVHAAKDTVGFQGSVQHNLHLASPAYLAAIAYILMALVVFAVPFDTYGVPDSMSYHKGTNRAMFVLSLAIPMVLSIFSINCMAINSGKWCKSWAWAQGILVACCQCFYMDDFRPRQEERSQVEKTIHTNKWLGPVGFKTIFRVPPTK